MEDSGCPMIGQELSLQEVFRGFDRCVNSIYGMALNFERFCFLINLTMAWYLRSFEYEALIFSIIVAIVLLYLTKIS